MKTVFTLTTFSFALVLMISCSKEEEVKPAVQDKVYNSGGTNNTSNNQSQQGGGSINTGKPIGTGSAGVSLPSNHPTSSVAACAACHKGGSRVPDWMIDELAKDNPENMVAETPINSDRSMEVK